MMRLCYCTLLLTLSWSTEARELALEAGELGQITLKPGFSTSLRFPSEPKTLGLGNQDLVLVEFVGRELLLKPLASEGQTNLFVYLLSGERFDFRIRIGPTKTFSFQVSRPRLKNPEPNLPTQAPERRFRESPPRQTSLNQRWENQHLSISLARLSIYGPHQLARVDFSVRNLSSSSLPLVDLDWQLFLKGQDTHLSPIPISLIYLPLGHLSPNQEVQGFLEFSQKDIGAPARGQAQAWLLRVGSPTQDSVEFNFSTD